MVVHQRGVRPFPTRLDDGLELISTQTAVEAKFTIVEKTEEGLSIIIVNPTNLPVVIARRTLLTAGIIKYPFQLALQKHL